MLAPCFRLSFLVPMSQIMTFTSITTVLHRDSVSLGVTIGRETGQRDMSNILCLLNQIPSSKKEREKSIHQKNQRNLV